MSVSSQTRRIAIRTIRSFAVTLLLSGATAAFGATGQQPTVQQLHADTEVARVLLERAERQLQFAQNLYNQAYYNGGASTYGGGYGNGGYGNAAYGNGYPTYYDQRLADRAQQQLTRASDALPGLRADAKDATQHLEDVKKDIEKRKADLDAAQSAVDVAVGGREKAFKDGQPYQDAQAAVRQAEAAVSAAETRLVKALAASDPGFRKLQALVAELDKQVKALREASPPADPNAIAEASKRWVDAKGQLVRRIDAAKDKDPQAIAARDQLNAARSALTKLNHDFEESLKADPAVADARRVLEQSRPAYQAAVKELAQAKRDVRSTQAAVNDAISAMQAASSDLAQAYGGAGSGAGVGWQFGGGGVYGIDPFTIAQDRLYRAQLERDRAAQAFNDAAARERAAIAGGTTPAATPVAPAAGTPAAGTAVASNAPDAGPTTAPSGIRYGQIATGGRPGAGKPVTIPPAARAPRFVGGSIVRPQAAAETVAEATPASVQSSAVTSAADSGTSPADPGAGVNTTTPAKTTTPAATPTTGMTAAARARALARERYEQRRFEWASRERTRRAMQDQQAANATSTTPGVVDRRQGVQAQADAQQQQQQSQQQQLQQRQLPQQQLQQQPAQPAPQKSAAAQQAQQQQQSQQQQQAQQQQQQPQSSGARKSGR